MSSGAFQNLGRGKDRDLKYIYITLRFEFSFRQRDIKIDKLMAKSVEWKRL